MTKNGSASKFWDNRLVWVLLAIISSVLLWVYVTMTEGDLITESYNGVVIEFSGRDALRDEKNLIITNVSSVTVSVRLSGTRRELSAISADSMMAVIDVSKITSAGGHPGIPEIVFASGTSTSTIDKNSITTSPSTITYEVEREVSKTIPVKGEFNGTTVEGFTAQTPTFEPGSVIIRGPESEIKQVSYAWVDIPHVDLEKTLNYESSYVLMSENGEVISFGNIELERETVNVTMQVFANKEVPLTVYTVDGAGASSENIKITCEPASITISGDKETLEGITSIALDTVDLASFAQTFTETYDIIAPEGTTIVSGVTRATVTIQVIGLETAVFEVTNISAANVTDGYKAEIITETVEVVLRGPADVLEQIKANNIRVVADATEIGSTTGGFTPNAKVIVDGFTGVGAIGEYKVDIRITRS